MSRQAKMLDHEHQIAEDASSIALFESAIRSIEARHRPPNVSESGWLEWLAACQEARKSRRNFAAGDPGSGSVMTSGEIQVAITAARTDEVRPGRLGAVDDPPTIDELRDLGVWPFPAPKR